MARFLSAEEIVRYENEGYVFPIRAIAASVASAYRARLESYEAQSGGPIGRGRRFKMHLLFSWAAELIRTPVVLDAVEDVIGPNILCWDSSFFIKEAQDPGFVSWHQDLTYWGLSPADITTVWVALSPSTTASGAMRVIPGSHKQEVRPHTDTYADNNLLSRGQEIAVDVDESTAVTLELQPGEASLHHVKLVHGSRPNTTTGRRIGFAIRYIPTHVKQTLEPRDSASLVRGTDEFGHFDHEPIPTSDLAPDMLALHAQIVAAHAKRLYAGTSVDQFR